jgi:alanine-glyoxylate transaminase/serine-glyoxylate transaminase/serine-pyruvate transaminase
MLFGLREALRMLVDEEGLSNVYARHARLASAVRAAVAAWGLSTVCEDPATASNTITAVRTPIGVDSNELLKHARERYDLSLGGGIGQLNGQAFRIGHLGSLNELEVMGTIGGIELAFADMGMDIAPGSGLLACQRAFINQSAVGTAQATPELAAVG